MEENNNGKYRSAYSNDGMDDYAKLVRSTSTPPKKKKSGGPKIIIAFIVLAIAGFALRNAHGTD